MLSIKSILTILRFTHRMRRGWVLVVELGGIVRLVDRYRKRRPGVGVGYMRAEGKSGLRRGQRLPQYRLLRRVILV